MKLLIIAGPYEADRIRKTAVAAGFETVAVEPGESLSGWITASRPQLIVMAPQMVHPDPALALAKVRSVPRGRVPIFLVGDAADAETMASLSEGFFVRPVSPEALLEHARVVLAAEKARESTYLGHDFNKGPSRGGTPAAPPRPAVALKPLITSAVPTKPARAVGRASGDASLLLAELDAGIDAFLDAQLSDALAATPEDLVPATVVDSPPPEPTPEFNGEPTANMRSGVMAQALKPPLEDTNPDRARSKILARYEVVEAGDYFQVLGVSREATAVEAQRAHERLARELAPEAIEEKLAVELRPQLEAIRVVAQEAVRILSDERLRPRYLSNLP